MLLSGIASAQPAATLRLGPPLVVVGGHDTELNGIRGAALLSDGRIVVGDGGNSRVVVFTPAGRVERTFGREGGGPREFRMLYLLAGIGDTIVTWDSGLSRVSAWTADGTVLRTVSLPAATNAVFDVKTIRHAGEYVGTRRTHPPRARSGLYVDSFAVLSVTAGAGSPTSLGHRAWGYSYFQGQEGSTSTYPTPFLGTTLVAASQGKLFWLPLGESTVTVTRADGSAGGRIALPASRPDDRARAKAYGDSIIAASRDKEPGWVRRIQAAFGPDFPSARPAVAQRAVTVGNTVWFQAFPEPRDRTTTWHVVDAAGERLIGRVELPRSARVLGGSASRVLVRTVDDDGVESVALHDFTRR